MTRLALAALVSWAQTFRFLVVAEKVDRDPRTVRRYITQAEKQLAEVLVDRYFRARDQADDAEEHELVDERGGAVVGVLTGPVAGVDLRGRGIDASAARSAMS